MTAPTRSATPRRIRYAILMCPPAGLVLLWLDRNLSLPKKILRSLFTVFYTPIYAGLVLGILYQFFGLQEEWRGGSLPHFTWSKTLPDYDRLEASRRDPTNLPPFTSQAKASVSPYWTEFRGPRRDGHYTEKSILTNWPPIGPRLLWRQPCGGGYASFAIANGLAYTIEQRRKQEAVAAYDAASGREIWVHRYDAWFQDAQGGDGPRATPTYHEGRLYSVGGLGDLRCFDAADGKLLWKKSLIVDNESKLLRYGLAGSPLIADDKLIVLAGGPGRYTVAAYHRVTGEPVWKTLHEQQGYSSPMLVTLTGERQILVLTGSRAVGLKLEDGALLWDYAFLVRDGNTIAQPVLLSTNRFLVSGGYGAGCACVEIQRTATGFAARTVWRNQNLKNKFTSSVLQDGFIYGLDEDLLACVDAATGKRKWKDGRYGYGQLLLASGHLVILCGNGDLTLVKATPDQHRELARVPGIRGKTWNHPAIADGRLFIRNAAEMACFDIGAK